MIKKYFHTILIISAVTFVVACNNISNELSDKVDLSMSVDAPLTVSLVDTQDVKVVLNVLKQYNDTADHAWVELRRIDSVRISDIGRLISAVSSSKGSLSKDELAAMNLLLSQTKACHLNTSSQFNNTSLQHYSSLSDSLMAKMYQISSRLQKSRKLKPMMVELVQEIGKDENEVIVKKSQYNQAAKKYNDFFWQKRSLMLQARSELPSKPIRACFGNSI